MKKSALRYILTAMLAIAMVFAFCACGGDDEGNGGNSGNTDTTKASTEVVSDYDTVVYTYSDQDVEEDQYSSTVTIEYDGDKVMGVTEVMVDDMSAAEDDIAQMLIEDYDGALDETGFKEMDGFKAEVTTEGKVRTEIKRFDLTKFDQEIYKKYVGLESDKDYVSFEELTGVYESGGYVKAEQPESTDAAEDAADAEQTK